MIILKEKRGKGGNRKKSVRRIWLRLFRGGSSSVEDGTKGYYLMLRRNDKM